jgi:Carboxypeptidase regulatory-like domain
VHGIVRNAITGSPLARALVRLDGDAGVGALTDGEGRFEIPGVPEGTQEFSVIKPGFFDVAAGSNGTFVGPGSREAAHTILVAPEMPDLVFTLSPLNAIRGQVLLSSGDPAQGISVSLLKQNVQGGRAMWQMGSKAVTNADGTYRFGSLPDGQYVVHTDLAMESGLDTNLIDAASASKIVRSGYPPQFYGAARDATGATKIRLQGGETAEADVSLALEPFHAVTAAVIGPGGGQPRDGDADVSYSASLFDAQGHELSYGALYDASTRAVQALLPDGTYTLTVAAFAPHMILGRQGSSSVRGSEPLAGSVDFAVKGRAIGNLRLPLSALRSSLVEVNIARTHAAAAQLATGSQSQLGVVLTVTDATGSGEEMTGTFAEGPISGPLHTMSNGAGTYWVHADLQDKSFCVDSLMAGGSNLAREPLVLGLNGAAEPLTLNLRDDCAALTLALPAALTAPAPGEEPTYEVYVVPAFDSAVDVIPETLRASSAASITLQGLTPGRYHVYTFDKPTALLYHSEDALSALANSGQEIELAPDAKADLVVEVPRQ